MQNIISVYSFFSNTDLLGHIKEKNCTTGTISQLIQEQTGFILRKNSKS